MSRPQDERYLHLLPKGRNSCISLWCRQPKQVAWGRWWGAKLNSGNFRDRKVWRLEEENKPAILKV